MKLLISLCRNNIDDMVKSPEFKKWFKKSKVSKGNKPIVTYHASKAKSVKAFENKFKTDLSLFGFHFGTERQASFRTTQHDFKSKGPSTGEYFLSLQKPLEVSHMASFAPDHLAEFMVDAGIITEDQYEEAREKFDYEDIPLGNYMVKQMKKKNYDGLVYENDREGKGKSYVPFLPNQIKSIQNNGDFSSSKYVHE